MTVKPQTYKTLSDTKWLHLYFNKSKSADMRKVSNYLFSKCATKSQIIMIEDDRGIKKRAFSKTLLNKFKKELNEDCELKILPDIRIDEDLDPHLGCYSYPDCDLNPNGCKILMGKDAEPFGHK